MDNNQKTTKAQHQWTSAQHGKERTTKEKERKGITKEKASHQEKEKDMATTITTATKEKENIMDPSAKETLSKDHQRVNMAKESHRAAKERATTQQQHVTNAVSKATSLEIVEYPSTTTTSETQHNKEAQHTTGSTIQNSMMHLGKTKTSLGKALPNQHNWHYHLHQE